MIFKHDQVLGTFLQATQPIMTKITNPTCGTVGVTDRSVSFDW